MEADNLFKLAAQKFEAALVINSKDGTALFLWGNMLSNQASTKKGTEAAVLLEQACEKYQQAYQVKQSFDLLYNWGNALLHRGNTLGKPEFFRQAAEKYKLAVQLKPRSCKALRNWGVALSKLARHMRSNHAEQLWDLAQEKFKACLKLKPQCEVYFNWGNALYRRAKGNPKAYQLWTQAGEKYLSALDVNPHYHDALYNWGKVVNCQASLKTLTEEEGKHLLFILSMYLLIFQKIASLRKFFFFFFFLALLDSL
jgi:tetratricopeptide (TPR) repeat protein